MKYRNQIAKFAGGLIAKAREIAQLAKEKAAYLAPAGAGMFAALLITPRVGAGGWSLFSFSMDGAMEDMMSMAEEVFNGLVGAYGNIWGIGLGFAILGMVTAAVFGLMKLRKS